MDEVAFERLIAGEVRGIVPTLARGGLSLLSLAYGAAVGLHGWTYRLGLRSPRRVGVPVVSIGNLTTGGTGKTPFVAHVVERLLARGRRPAILSRGYRAGADGTNDERRVLDALCPGVPHEQSPDRIASAERAIREGANVLVLDDGFQHRRLERDLDIVLVDALRPWGHGHLLPRGLLREPIAALRRASLVVVTRVDQAPPDRLQAITDRLARIRGTADHVKVAFPPRELVDPDGCTEPLATIGEQRVVAFCGIGNPIAFRQSLLERGIEVASLLEFPDHHHFAAADLERVASEADRQRADLVLCTEKDLVKLPDRRRSLPPIRAVRIRAEIREGVRLSDLALDRLLDGQPVVGQSLRRAG